MLRTISRVCIHKEGEKQMKDNPRAGATGGGV